ncbi:MAG: DUF2285 domain-containing protein [Pseudomonadota bacterium]|nr:DUF2285 domain-containing protein [Pseudomonadota bacterium]
MIPPWLPDWKDESAYPEKLAPEFWAWEFLRRNAEYQEDYGVFSNLPYADNGNEEHRLMKKWGVFPLHDPDESQPLTIERGLYSEKPPYVYFDGRVRHSEIWHSPPFVFDLRQSLDKQLAECKQWLKCMRDNRGENRGFSAERGKRIQDDSIYRTYLRVLDAERCGASREEMADRLYPDSHTDTPSKALHVARELRDGGYRDLLARL